MNKPIVPLAVSDQSHYRREHDDEISLVDLWLVLARRHKLIALVTLVALLLGAYVAFTKPIVYTYSAAIEIGSRLVRDDVRPVDNPQTVVAKIQESYIPSVLGTFYTNFTNIDDRPPVYSLKARIPDKSEIIVVEAQGTKEQGEHLLPLLNGVIDKLREDHERIHVTLKKEIEVKENLLKNQYQGLQDEAEMLEAEKKRISELGKLLKTQIIDLEKLLSEAENNRQAATRGVRDELNAMALLLLDSQVRETRSQLSELRERLQIELANDEDKLIKRIADNLRKQSEVNDNLVKAQLELANFRETRAIVPPMSSLKPVGGGKGLILILAAILGVFLGIFAAFFAQFLSVVREAGLDEAK